MGKRIAAHHQKFERIVEGRGVRRAVADHRPQFFQIVAQHLRFHVMPARIHPIDVAAYRIDFSVMAEKAERLREAPGGEGIGRKPLMEQRDGGGEIGVLEIQVELRQIRRQHHALVHHGPGRHGNDVEIAPRRLVLIPKRVMGLLSNDIELALESVRVRCLRPPLNQHLTDDRLRLLDAFPQHAVVDRNIAPADQHLPFTGNRRFDRFHREVALRGVVRQKDHAYGVVAHRWQGDAARRELLPHESIGNLNQNTGAVAGQRIRPDRAPMIQIMDDLQRLMNDLVLRLVMDVRNKPEAARIMLIGRVIEPLLNRQTNTVAPDLVAHALTPNWLRGGPD